MAGNADVTITYDFLPTESSIRDSAERVVKQLNRASGQQKWGSGIYSEKAYKEMTENMKKISGSKGGTKDPFDLMINVLRATQQRTSLQTKLSSARKVGVGLFGGGEEAGEAGGAAGGAVGAGGGIMGALSSIAGLLVVISVAMTLISAFFDAVGPIIKVVMKMLSAMILILLMPFLKRGLPILFGILTWMIKMSKGISEFVDNFFTYMERAFGKLLGGDITGLFELILGPIGMLIYSLVPKIVEFLQKVDWNGIASAIVSGLKTVFAIGKEILKGIVVAFFGEDAWEKVRTIATFIKEALAPEGIWEKINSMVTYINEQIFQGGLWESIKGVVDYIGTEIFGKDLWDKIKTTVSEIDTMLNTEWASIISSLQIIGSAIKPIADSFKGLIDWFENLAKPWGDIISGGGGGGGGGGGADDFISRPGFGVQKFSPSDTIIGMKNPGGMGGVNITNNLTVSAGVDKNEFRKILAELNRQQARDLRTRTSYVGGVYA